jgi:glycosyl transferase family 25
MVVNMNNYVISLSSADVRRKHIHQEFSGQDITFKFFDAVEPPKNIEVAQFLSVRINNTELTAGEISCLLSHLSLWKKAIDENLDYIAIFEDDIYLGDRANEFLTDRNWVKNCENIIKLEAFAKKAEFSFKVHSRYKKDRKLYRLNGIHLGCAGYILSNNACKSLLKAAQNYEKMIAVDHILFEEYINNGEYAVYQLNPALCIQSDILKSECMVFESGLEKERRKRFNIKHVDIKKKLTFKGKMAREFFRVVSQFFQIVRFLKKRNVKFK